jgi:serine/threonine protein kinase/ABC-type branched-subunit amino acid transport system substrate-binding protein
MLRAAVPLLRGDVVGHYVIDGFLGAGGMGQVYRAFDPRLQRTVALKIVLAAGGGGQADAGDTGDGTVRLLREARAAAALEHPNVVSVYDVGQVASDGAVRGATYIAMELVRGQSLRAYVRDPSVAMDERLRWLADVASALAAAHRAGVVHRDVKPVTVMVREDGLVKVLDFGIAKRAPGAGPVDGVAGTERSTTAGVALGTPLYMAPEQLRAEPLDGRTDQFAWGVVAYELLSGQTPWSGAKTSFELASQILGGDPRPIGEVADVPAPVAAAVMRALRKDPAERFDSMDALLVAFAGVVAKGPSRRPPSVEEPRLGTERSSAMELPASGARRTTRRVALFGALALGLGLVGAVVSRSHRFAGTAPSSGSSSASGAAACAGSRACIDAHGGEPWTCRATDHACVRIASEDCAAQLAPEDLAADDTVWFGALLPLTGARGEAWGKRGADAVELARRDFATVGGILGPKDGPLRRLGLVLCDATVNPRRAAEHLAELGVPVVLGPAATLKDTIDVTSNVFVPRRTLVLALFEESPLVTRIPQPKGTARLVWRLTSSAQGDGEALAHLVSDYVEPLVKRRAGGRSPRLAIVRSESATPQAILDAFASSVQIDGRALVDAPSAFRQYTFRRGELSASAKSEMVADLVAFAPDVIVYADGEVFEDELVGPIEAAWTAPARPLYVGEGPLANPNLAAFIGASAERRRRFLGVDLPANTAENFRFALHYNELFTPKVTPGTAPGNTYDAFYVAAYAAAATRKATITGADVAAAMTRLGGDGPPVSVGPESIFAAYDVLRGDGRLHLSGAASQLDLDPSTGEIPSDFAVYCFAVDRNGRASEPIESGLRFDHAAHRMVGAPVNCP